MERTIPAFAFPAEDGRHFDLHWCTDIADSCILWIFNCYVHLLLCTPCWLGDRCSDWSTGLFVMMNNWCCCWHAAYLGQHVHGCLRGLSRRYFCCDGPSSCSGTNRGDENGACQMKQLSEFSRLESWSPSLYHVRQHWVALLLRNSKSYAKFQGEE